MIPVTRVKISGQSVVLTDNAYSNSAMTENKCSTPTARYEIAFKPLFQRCIQEGVLSLSEISYLSLKADLPEEIGDKIDLNFRLHQDAICDVCQRLTESKLRMLAHLFDLSKSQIDEVELAEEENEERAYQYLHLWIKSGRSSFYVLYHTLLYLGQTTAAKVLKTRLTDKTEILVPMLVDDLSRSDSVTSPK